MNAALHMLDTGIASFVIKGRSTTVEAKLAELPPDRICVSAITRAELMYGLKRLGAAHRLQVGVIRPTKDRFICFKPAKAFKAR